MDDEQKKLAEELLGNEQKKPSFAKQLFLGKFDAGLVCPFPSPSEQVLKETEELLAKVKAFADAKLDAKKIDQTSEIPQEVIEGLGELGILSLTIPKEYGGLGLSQYTYCKIMEEIAGRCGATALFINAHQSVGLKALLLFGTDEQKNKWLRKLGTGKAIAAFSLTEPNAGSDAGGIETRAIYDSKKNVYRITGHKQWTTNGSIAEILTVMAKTEDGKVTAFIVTPDMPGFKVVAAALDKVGMRGSKTSNIDYEDVEVPAENILGPKGSGLKVCLTVLDYGRTTFGATCTGNAKVLIKRAKEHAINRYQFKRPLASFGLVKEKIAKMNALAYAMEASTDMTAGLIDSHVEDVMLESAILKVFTSDSVWTILYDTMQIFGGRSFFTDQPFERMMRDARLNMIGEGSNEVLRAFIGVVGLREAGMFLKNMDAQSGFSMLKRMVFKPKIPLDLPEIQTEVAGLESRIRNFGWNVAKVAVKYREEVLEKQLTLNRLAIGAIALYTTTAVLSRLQSDPTSLEIGKFYCEMAFSDYDNAMRSLFDNNDEEVCALSDKIIGQA